MYVCMYVCMQDVCPMNLQQFNGPFELVIGRSSEVRLLWQNSNFSFPSMLVLLTEKFRNFVVGHSKKAS